MTYKRNPEINCMPDTAIRTLFLSVNKPLFLRRSFEKAQSIDFRAHKRYLISK